MFILNFVFGKEFSTIRSGQWLITFRTAGEFFDAWRNRAMAHFDRLVIAFRAMFSLVILEDELSLKCTAYPGVFPSANVVHFLAIPRHPIQLGSFPNSSRSRPWRALS